MERTFESACIVVNKSVRHPCSPFGYDTSIVFSVNKLNVIMTTKQFQYIVM